jgi:hypothetical protein
MSGIVAPYLKLTVTIWPEDLQSFSADVLADEIGNAVHEILQSKRDGTLVSSTRVTHHAISIEITDVGPEEVP